MSVICLFLKINLSTIISIKRSRRELSIDMVIDRDISDNYKFTLFSCFIFVSKTGMGIPSKGRILLFLLNCFI